MYVCLYVCLWRLGSGSLALPAGIGTDLPSTLPAPAKVSRLRSQRLGSGSLALPAGVAPDLPSTLPAPAKVSRHQSHTPAPPASPISRNFKVKHCRCLKLDATGVTEALATTTRILLMPHRPSAPMEPRSTTPEADARQNTTPRRINDWQTSHFSREGECPAHRRQQTREKDRRR